MKGILATVLRLIDQLKDTSKCQLGRRAKSYQWENSSCSLEEQTVNLSIHSKQASIAVVGKLQEWGSVRHSETIETPAAFDC